jgi:hypothetical protein
MAVVGSTTLLPGVVHVLGGTYLRDIGDAVALTARQLSCVVVAEVGWYGAAE